MKDHLHCPSCGAHGLHDVVDIDDGVIAWCHACWHRHVPDRCRTAPQKIEALHAGAAAQQRSMI